MSGFRPANRRRATYWAAGAIFCVCAAIAAWAAHSIRAMEMAHLIACADDSSNRAAQWACRKSVYLLRLSADDVKELNRMAGASFAAHLADKEEAEKMLKFFLLRGVDINSVDTTTAGAGLTALHKAVYANSPQEVELLLAYGARADVRSDKNQTALELATELQQQYPKEDRSEVIRLLAASGRPRYSGFVRR